MRHLDLLQRLPLKTIGWQNWVQKLLEVEKTPNKPSQRPKIQLLEQGDLFLSEQQSGSSVQEIENALTWLLKHTTGKQGDLFSSCVPVSIKRSDQDKDADENVDAEIM